MSEWRPLDWEFTAAWVLVGVRRVAIVHRSVDALARGGPWWEWAVQSRRKPRPGGWRYVAQGQCRRLGWAKTICETVMRAEGET